VIGIFDSGFGGLTVMKEYLKKYPQYDYMYLGDQANMPYGGHSPEHINNLVEKNVKFLVDKGCELIIIACNTASADALRHVQGIYKGKPAILGVLVPAVEEALRVTSSGNIGVIGTRGTISSNSYIRETDKYKGDLTIRVHQQPCPLLVPLIEEGMISAPPTRMILRNYLRPLKHADIDTLVLGCTHYPLLHNEIQRMMGKKCKVLSSSKAAADAIESYFKKHSDTENKLSKNGKRTYYTTDCHERFSDLGSQFLGEKITGEKILI